MKKQYVISEEEYVALVPRIDLERLQHIIDRATEECIRKAHKRKSCIRNGNRRYCVHYDPAYEGLDCSFAIMCNSKMKKWECAPRELDHMIE